VYCPKYHKTSYDFMEKVYGKIFELLDKHPDAFVVMEGDFNSCMSRNDSVNRLGTKLESTLAAMIKSNNNICEITDVYRSMED
jgi:hypothetical protein